MDTDPELSALSTCLAALSPLDAGARQRSIEWLSRKLDIAPSALTPRVTKKEGVEEKEEEVLKQQDETVLPKDIATAFEQTSPQSNADKALVVAWFITKVLGQPDLTGQSINKELKHLGHGLTHITDTIDQLSSQKPALMIQTRKSGTSRQARKTYKLTEEGAKAVNVMRSKPKSTS